MRHRDAIFAIEALRAGIPTRNSTRLLPDMRQNISQRVWEDLDSFDREQIPAGRILWGQYGQGKTHALTTLEHRALDHNFAVSRISLSREVSCHNLMQFYSQVAPRIQTPDSSLEGMQNYLHRMRLDELKSSVLFHEGRYVNPLPVHVLEDYFHAEGEDKEKLYGDLCGSRLPVGEISRIHRLVKSCSLPKLGFKVTEHASAYFGLMADLIQLCGFEGWVILIDEVELIGRLGKISRCKAYQNLHWLLNGENKMPYPIYTVAAAASRLQDDLWYGKINNDRSVMPELAALRAKAEESDRAEKEMEAFFACAIDERSLQLRPVKDADLSQLLDEICELHSLAYNWSASLSSLELIRHLGAQPVRSYVRAALEYLDLEYLYGASQIPETTNYVEGILNEEEAACEESFGVYESNE